MVYLKRSCPELDAAATNSPEAKAEGEHGALNKRPKLNNAHENVFDIPPSQYNPLDEPSPLGLRLRKSPSLLDLIQMTLSQANNGSSSASSVQTLTPKPGEEKNIIKENASSASREKLKASNFSALRLTIGDWELVSRFDGDLVAKCYFAKRKLVWEILQNGLKSKMEIQWPDITALKANLPSDGPGSLSITLGKPPRFFKETNPQPRKHTLWQSSSDFTDGKASIFRRHILQCPSGVLNKQYDKLVQFDEHLNLVSQQPDLNPSPYFDERVTIFKNPYPKAPPIQETDQLGTAKRSPVSALQDVSSSSSSFSSIGFAPENVSLEAPSPCSAIDLRGSEVNSSQIVNPSNWEQLNALGIHKSMSMSDLVNQIGHCISERITKKDPPEGQEMLENIAQFLLSDSNLASSSDENKLMSRVNSLCCLLQDPPSSNAGPQIEEPMGMSRKDSFSDLLLSLPRISSLPKFLFDISEDEENQTK